MNTINSFCKNNNYSKNNLFIEAVKEKIEHDTGKSFDKFLKEAQAKQEEQSDNKNIESNSEIAHIDNN